MCFAISRHCGSANSFISAARFCYVYVCVCVCVRECVCACVCVCFAIRCHCGSANSFWPHNGQNALSEPHKIDTLVMSHSLIRSPVRSHRSLTRSLGTACFARAPQRSFARSLAHSLAPEVLGTVVSVIEMNASISYSFNPLCGGNNS